MSFFIGALKIIFVLGFLIFIHEGGHFLAAKACKVKVKEFSIGFGPKIFVWQGKETKYTIRLIPLGGFVDMLGESERKDEPGSFSTAAIWKRFIIVLAGATVNIVFGLAVYFSWIAIDFNQVSTIINEISVEYSENLNELLPGDEIVSINGNSIHIKNDMDYVLSRIEDENVEVLVKRDGVLKSSKVKVTKVDGRYIFGVVLKRAESSFKNRLYYGYYQTAAYVKAIGINLKMLFTGGIKANDMMGPIGISEIIVKTKGISEYIYFLSIISLSLGISNLLPIPALDGGRLLLLVIEGIRRKPLDEALEIKIQMLGFSFLILLSIYISFNDILRISG